MWNDILFIIYLLFVKKGVPKIVWIERNFKFIGSNCTSLDDEKNESTLYGKLFNEEGRRKFEALYQRLLNEMRQASYEECSEVFEALMFFQQVAATALWKYHCNIGQEVELFARDFDRLDIPSERRRLYEKVKQSTY